MNAYPLKLLFCVLFGVTSFLPVAIGEQENREVAQEIDAKISLSRSGFEKVAQFFEANRHTWIKDHDEESSIKLSLRRDIDFEAFLPPRGEERGKFLLQRNFLGRHKLRLKVKLKGNEELSLPLDPEIKIRKGELQTSQRIGKVVLGTLEEEGELPLCGHRRIVVADRVYEQLKVRKREVRDIISMSEGTQETLRVGSLEAIDEALTFQHFRIHQLSQRFEEITVDQKLAEMPDVDQYLFVTRLSLKVKNQWKVDYREPSTGRILEFKLIKTFNPAYEGRIQTRYEMEAEPENPEEWTLEEVGTAFCRAFDFPNEVVWQDEDFIGESSEGDNVTRELLNRHFARKFIHEELEELIP